MELKSFIAMGTRIKVMSPSAINNNGQLVPKCFANRFGKLEEVGLRVSLLLGRPEKKCEKESKCLEVLSRGYGEERLFFAG